MALSAEQQLKIWLRDVDKAVDKFDRRDRVSALRKGAALVRKDARNLTKVRNPSQKSGIGTKPNPRYQRTGAKGTRAKKGKGKIVAKYVPGNLKKSPTTLTFRRSKDVFVGPRFGNKKIPVYGKTIGTADAYYAAMVFGSRRQYANKILRPALNRNAQEIRNRVLTALREKVPQYL